MLDVVFFLYWLFVVLFSRKCKLKFIMFKVKILKNVILIFKNRNRLDGNESMGKYWVC